MILGLGIDMVDIERFKDWHTKPANQLTRVFSAHEITYCLEIPLKSAERFAVRYAAKEAFYKALCSWQPETTLPLITLCPIVQVTNKKNGVPKLTVDWDALPTPFEPTCSVSLTHTATLAMAQVILESHPHRSPFPRY